MRIRAQVQLRRLGFHCIDDLLGIGRQWAFGEFPNQLFETADRIRNSLHPEKAASIIEQDHVQELGIRVVLQYRFKGVDSPGIVFLFVVVVRHLGHRISHSSTLWEMIEDLLVFLECPVTKLQRSVPFGVVGHHVIALGNAKLGLASQLAGLHVY